jgi:hypothetical protein
MKITNFEFTDKEVCELVEILESQRERLIGNTKMLVTPQFIARTKTRLRIATRILNKINNSVAKNL